MKKKLEDVEREHQKKEQRILQQHEISLLKKQMKEICEVNKTDSGLAKMTESYIDNKAPFIKRFQMTLNNIEFIGKNL